MAALEALVLIGVIVLVGAFFAPKLHIPTPLLMLLLGVAVGFIPAVQTVKLPSEAVLVLFLPAILFWESMTTSLREIRRDLRGILLLSTVLVAATAFGIAGIASVLGLTWGAALILGAALAPTDATAVGAVATSLPHRNMTMLRAESLINDGTALVIFSIAIGLGVSHIDYSGWQITGLVALSYVGGGAVGALFGWGGSWILRRLTDPVAINATLVVIPFAAFLLADLITASGVIAVVVAGLALSQTGPRASTPQSRQQTFSFWSLSTFFLNNALFVLVGFEVHSAVQAVPHGSVGTLILLTVLAWLALIVIRFAFQMVAGYLILLLDRRPGQRERQLPYRARVISSLAGFRGAVSLAVALAVPATFASGARFPGRDEIVFVASGVVLLSLLVQGVLLPFVVRWANFPPDSTFDDELERAELEATEEAIKYIPEAAARLGTDDEVRDFVANQFEDHRSVLDTSATDDEAERLREQDRQAMELRLALLERRREVMITLRDKAVISDTTLRTAQTRLDREALRLTQPEILE